MNWAITWALREFVKSASEFQSGKIHATEGAALSSLQGKTLHKVKHVETKGKPWTLSLINNKLYSCEQYAGLSIYSMDLDLERTIPAGDMKYVSAVSGLEEDNLLVAASKGLFIINSKGAISKVVDGQHLDVKSRDSDVYALNNNSEMHIYKYVSEALDSVKTVPLPSRCDKLALGSDILYASDSSKHCIYVLSQDTGELLATHGSYGDEEPHHLNGPRCSHTDADDAVLVCDAGHNSVKYMKRDGTFHVISIDEEVGHPIGAVFLDNMLYVSSAFFGKKGLYKLSL